MYPLANTGYITRHLVSLRTDFLAKNLYLTVQSIHGGYVTSQIMSSTEYFGMFHLTFSDLEP
jgi:hypothetical protein